MALLIVQLVQAAKYVVAGLLFASSIVTRGPESEHLAISMPIVREYIIDDVVVTDGVFAWARLPPILQARAG